METPSGYPSAGTVQAEGTASAVLRRRGAPWVPELRAALCGRKVEGEARGGSPRSWSGERPGSRKAWKCAADSRTVRGADRGGAGVVWGKGVTSLPFTKVSDLKTPFSKQRAF